MEDIVARLAKGESADDIAKEFTTALNGAIDVQKKKATEDEKMRDAQAVADALNAFVAKYYGVESTIVDGKTIIDMYEMMDGVLTSFEKLGDCGFKFSMKTPEGKNYQEPTVKKIKAKTPEDIFTKFFKTYGI